MTTVGPGVTIRPFASGDAPAVASLVLRIQQQEFGIPISAEEQPDLLDIPSNYQVGRGNFWVAVADGPVVGSIGLLDIGRGDGAIRKMFVAPSHRGSDLGVAAGLLRSCLTWAKSRELSRILLGTTEQFRAAHRFYEKSGFSPVALGELPAHFPRMRLDTRFYQYDLASLPANAAPGRRSNQAAP